MCGVTLAECHCWGPVCRKTGQRVCADCCYRCEHHISWSGIWHCGFRSEEQLREERRKRARDRFDEENRKISEAFMKKRKEEARQWAIKKARARARQQKNTGGRQL